MKYSLRNMMTFSIRDILWFMVVVGLIAVIVRDRWLDRIPLAFEGHCPVTLVHSNQWEFGDPNCQAVYEGRRYLFASAAEKDVFLGDPRLYVPVRGGNDAVRLTDENRTSPGSIQHSLLYKFRIYLFDSEETIRKFETTPAKYAQP